MTEEVITEEVISNEAHANPQRRGSGWPLRSSSRHHDWSATTLGGKRADRWPGCSGEGSNRTAYLSVPRMLVAYQSFSKIQSKLVRARSIANEVLLLLSFGNEAGYDPWTYRARDQGRANMNLQGPESDFYRAFRKSKHPNDPPGFLLESSMDLLLHTSIAFSRLLVRLYPFISRSKDVKLPSMYEISMVLPVNHSFSNNPFLHSSGALYDLGQKGRLC